tara:strand:- start:14587 stop:15057 length:471 start_codon:yes stop_codon:yes gene_type:complete
MDKLREFIRFFNPENLTKIPDDEKKIIGHGSNQVIILGDIITDKVTHDSVLVKSDRVSTNLICSSNTLENCSSIYNADNNLTINDEGKTTSKIVFDTHVNISTTSGRGADGMWIRENLQVKNIVPYDPDPDALVRIHACCSHLEDPQNACKTHFCN